MQQRRLISSRFATVALLTMVGCASPSISDSPAATSVASPAASTSTATLDLSLIVVQPEDSPPEQELTGTATGRDVLVEPLHSQSALDRIAAQSGFVDGLSRSFSGAGGSLLSWVTQFETEGDAESAFLVYLDELQLEGGYAFGIGAKAGLGDEGTCLQGNNPFLDGLHEAICVWRSGTLVLIAGGPIEPDSPQTSFEIRSIADAMDALATAPQ